MLTIRNLQVEYNKESPVLKGINLSMEPGKIHGLVGLNGAGKTTLLRHICRQLQGRSDLKMVYMPQDYRELRPYDQTPVDFLSRGQTRQEITQPKTIFTLI